MKIKSAWSPSQHPTVLFSMYQNDTWTTRCLVDETIHPATHFIILKIVGFLVFLTWKLKIRLNSSMSHSFFDLKVKGFYKNRMASIKMPAFLQTSFHFSSWSKYIFFPFSFLNLGPEFINN